MPDRTPDDPIFRELRFPNARGQRVNTPAETRIRRAMFGLIAAAILIVIIAPAIATRLTDWLWYSEIGFERVFWTKIVAQWGLGFAMWLIAFAVLAINVRIALRGHERDKRSIRMHLMDTLRAPATASTLATRLGVGLAYPAAAFFALFMAFAAGTQWRTALQFIYRTPFSVNDPVFGRDVGYYVFTMPALTLAVSMMFMLLISLFVLLAPLYAARGEIESTPRQLIVRPRAQTHFAALAALFLVLEAIRLHLLSGPALLLGEHTVLTGATYTDLHARLPAIRVFTVLAILGAAFIVWGAFRGRLVPIAVRVVAGYVLLRVVGALIPLGLQRLSVQPNELAREAPQIVHHIAATRQAWGIDGIEEHDLGLNTRLTPELIESNRATINNVRLWDREPLLQTFGQIQSIRTYYDFVSVDDDRYVIGNELRQVMLSARELNAGSLPTRGFINEHLTYTHGMGVTLGPTNQVTPEGLPVLFIKDLPPVSTVEMKITRPQIYFGELSNEFVLAPTRQREFDYPAGEGEASYSSYDGKAGVPVGSFLRRLVYAFRFGSLNILLSRDVTEQTRILYHRDIVDRAQRALPFVALDRDPYIVIDDSGRLKWMLDAYTMSSRYPYARATGGINYMRNSVKLVIDAYDGDVSAYVSDARDPILRTLARIYPGLFQPLDAMPADLRRHLRYPEDLFRLQTGLYATYHMRDPETFYHREDHWQIPGARTAASARGRETGEGFLRHMVMLLPGEKEPEFIFMRPFTPRQKENLAAWIVARNDGANYGRLSVYRFPRQSLVFGPNQIVNRINQDTEVARQISLWDQRGSEVLRGELLVLPIEESLIYVQPLYLRAEGGRIPELKRVIVAHEGRVAMDSTLDLALQSLVGGVARTRPADAPATTPVAATTTTTDVPRDSLLSRAAQHYERARAAQRADDWATYGTEMRRLGEVLRMLQRP